MAAIHFALAAFQVPRTVARSCASSLAQGGRLGRETGPNASARVARLRWRTAGGSVGKPAPTHRRELRVFAGARRAARSGDRPQRIGASCASSAAHGGWLGREAGPNRYSQKRPFNWKRLQLPKGGHRPDSVSPDYSSALAGIRAECVAEFVRIPAITRNDGLTSHEVRYVLAPCQEPSLRRLS